MYIASDGKVLLMYKGFIAAAGMKIIATLNSTFFRPNFVKCFKAALIVISHY